MNARRFTSQSGTTSVIAASSGIGGVTSLILWPVQPRPAAGLRTKAPLLWARIAIALSLPEGRGTSRGTNSCYGGQNVRLMVWEQGFGGFRIDILVTYHESPPKSDLPSYIIRVPLLPILPSLMNSRQARPI
jgi:hypothetical protein